MTPLMTELIEQSAAKPDHPKRTRTSWVVNLTGAEMLQFHGWVFVYSDEVRTEFPAATALAADSMDTDEQRALRSVLDQAEFRKMVEGAVDIEPGPNGSLDRVYLRRPVRLRLIVGSSSNRPALAALIDNRARPIINDLVRGRYITPGLKFSDFFRIVYAKPSKVADVKVELERKKKKAA